MTLRVTECNMVDVTVLRTGEFEGPRWLAKKALASARALERPDLVARALDALTRQGMLARSLARRAQTNERDRMSYLRSLAVLGEEEGDAGGAIGLLHEAEALAEEIGLPGELWQIQGRIADLHARRGETEEAQRAFSRTAQTLRTLAVKIEDEGLRENFLSAPWVRHVLGHRNSLAFVGPPFGEPTSVI
jgi:hypothetical protein